ncbi:disease resistance protein RPV1-like [Diospyros lotus]|uniref:disease resistance protein RPV1-like n=1 Tax=Diospyros lotus TaxID=55363 RepID=UPI0022550B34|nr:disease resistance protein RPV1-like [Diospyros lotus]
MNEEMESLPKNGIWELIPRLEGKMIGGCKWVFKRKEGTFGVENFIFKAMLIAKGYNQIQGVDFNDVFSLVVKHYSIQFLLVAMHDLELEQLDVKIAFIHGADEDLMWLMYSSCNITSQAFQVKDDVGARLVYKEKEEEKNGNGQAQQIHPYEYGNEIPVYCSLDCDKCNGMAVFACSSGECEFCNGIKATPPPPCHRSEDNCQNYMLWEAILGNCGIEDFYGSVHANSLVFQFFVLLNDYKGSPRSLLFCFLEQLSCVLSFRGENTRWTFVDHLYTALVNAEFCTFRDDDGIERRESIKLALKRAIKESKVSIIVFSKNYASSSWCLDELVMILKRQKIGNFYHMVLPVFYGVDPSEVRKQKGDYAEAFVRHEAQFKEGKCEAKKWMEKLKRWREALEKAVNLAGMALHNHADGYESKFIQKIVKAVDDKLRPTILNVAPYLVGLHSRARMINLWLEDGGSDVGIVVICGIGGIGKTTIAKFVYNLNFSKFEGSSFIADIKQVSEQQNGLIQLQRKLLSDILRGRKEKKINNVDEGLVKIKQVVSSKRVLIVLDDVDKQEQLDAVFGM